MFWDLHFIPSGVVQEGTSAARRRDPPVSAQRHQERRQDHQRPPRRGRPDLAPGGRRGQEERGRVPGV